MAERSKALDWNSSNIFTGVRGFESHPLRQICPTLSSGCYRVGQIKHLSYYLSRRVRPNCHSEPKSAHGIRTAMASITHYGEGWRESRLFKPRREAERCEESAILRRG